MRVLKSKQVKKFIEKQDKPTQTRLNTALNSLPAGDVIPIVGLSDTYRLRVGNFRAIFVKEKEIIKVTILDNRGQVYKK
jgi:mRNA-degrading endonuclease RelE of RelBE toxin-antitoxin system